MRIPRRDALSDDSVAIEVCCWEASIVLGLSGRGKCDTDNQSGV